MATRARKRVTLKDVAEHAGVSLKTASNVKNDWPHVSAETRQKVKQAMADLGYRPSHLAKSLVTGRSETVGVIIPDIANPFFSAVFRGCEDELTARGYSAFLCNTDENPEKEQYYIDLLVNHGVDALLLWGSSLETKQLTQHIRDEVPVVSVDGLAQQGIAHGTVVNVDNEGGAQALTEHLIAAGHRQIAYISGASRRLPAQQRMNGYRKALSNAELPLNDSLIVRDQPTIGGGYTATIALLQQHTPDALFCYNDLMAVGAIAAARELDYDVPGDIAVVGFDDTMPASLVSPLLTTVRIPKYELGRFAVRALFERLDNGEPSAQTITMPVELRIRESCGTRTLSATERRELLRSLAHSGSVNLPGRPPVPQSSASV